VATNNSTTTTTTHRKSLHKKKASLSQYQTTPITKHYQVSKQILAAFDSHWSNQLWVTAYAVGLQFVETALLEIPKHGYFYSDRHERERMESSLEAARVAHLLQDLLQRQLEQHGVVDVVVGKDQNDASAVAATAEHSAGVLVPQGNLPHVQKLLALALEQIEQASSDQDDHPKFQLARDKVEEEIQNTDDFMPTTGEWIVCGGTGSGGTSILESSESCLEYYCGAGSFLMGSSNQNSTSDKSFFGKNHATRVNSASKSTILKEPMQAIQEGAQFSGGTRTQGPLLHRSSSVGSIPASEELMLEKALFLSGLEVSVPAEATFHAYDKEERVPPPKQATRVPSAAILELATLAKLYHEDFDNLQREGLVRLSFADTYQGRLPASTNGCTVIAPMLCIQHLMVELDDFYYDAGGDPGLSDSAITHVIDKDSPVVLTELRRKLGLSEHAFLIPADAHDYLLDNAQLTADQFETVLGGNILHDDHLNAFISALEAVKHRKIAATMFFHEHVVAILKLKRVDRHGTVSWWYDFIDSLPQKETLRRSDESPYELCQRMGVLHGLSDEDTIREDEMVAFPKTARIRCLTAEALKGVIRWYACSKFNDENMAYIDQYQWDDSTCDFDPRVFQAFIWGGAPFGPRD
jgi:hypothetical protein